MLSKVPPSKVTPKVRDWKFGRNTEVPPVWHSGGSGVTRFFDSLSILIPAGERFFIHALKAQLERIEDPALKHEVELFITQEALHNREHEHYNARLMAQVPAAARMDARAKRILSFAKRTLTPMQQVAVTCAIEHFTAVMGHYVLNEPRILRGAHPEMAALWQWHSVEEMEHKAVAFDAFRALGGTELDRIAAMLVTTVMFWALIIEQLARFMHADGEAFKPRAWLQLVRFLFVEPGGMPHVIRMCFDYYARGFHPWNHDNSPLIASFRTQQ